MDNLTCAVLCVGCVLCQVKEQLDDINETLRKMTKPKEKEMISEAAVKEM
jgi:hypothetical protein